MLINLQPTFAAEDPKPSVAEVYASGFSELGRIQRIVQDLYALLQTSHPIVIYEEGQFHIVDFFPAEGAYAFVKSVVTEMAAPKGIRASFPLAACDGKPSCIDTGSGFRS